MGSHDEEGVGSYPAPRHIDYYIQFMYVLVCCTFGDLALYWRFAPVSDLLCPLPSQPDATKTVWFCRAQAKED